MRILIDGYNLIFQCGLLGRAAMPMALEKARKRLVSELSRRMDDESKSVTTIVFDASQRPIKEVADEERVDGLRLVYAVNHEEADALIEDLIRRHATPKKLVVVSSDHRIQKAARRRKATAIDSDVWFDGLEKNLRREKGGNELPGKPCLGDYNPFPPGYGENL